MDKPVFEVIKKRGKPEGVKSPCGMIDYLHPPNAHIAEMSCRIVGCKGCGYFNGVVYFNNGRWQGYPYMKPIKRKLERTEWYV
jgi:hypothetical protein